MCASRNCIGHVLGDRPSEIAGIGVQRTDLQTLDRDGAAERPLAEQPAQLCPDVFLQPMEIDVAAHDLTCGLACLLNAR